VTLANIEARLVTANTALATAQSSADDAAAALQTKVEADCNA